MARITVEVHDAGAIAGIENLAARLRNTRVLLDSIGAYLETVTDRRFERERAPDGAPWKPSRRALDEGGQTLTKSSRLRRSITRRVSDRELQVGTNAVYAAIHQFGGTIRPRKGRFLVFGPKDDRTFARSVSMPARPFLGIDDRDRNRIRDIVIGHIGKAP